MSLARMRRFAVLNFIFVMMMLTGIAILTALSWSDEGLDSRISSNLLAHPLVLLILLVGTLIAMRRPENLIGLLLCLIATSGATLGLVEAYFEYDLYAYEGTLPGSDVAVWMVIWLWIWVLVPPITFLFLLSPNGRLPSPRWRPVAWLNFATLLLLSLEMFRSGPIEGYENLDNPFGIEAIEPLLELFVFVGYILLIPSIGFSGAALVQRFRRSRGLERQQLKWFAMAAVIALLVYVASWPISYLIVDVWGYATFVAMIPPPIAVGIAILRHQLYDIDRILNRTLVYALLSISLAATYFGLVVGLEAALRSVSGGSDLAVVVTTLIVAALFLPARRRVQDAVDRRFNRRAYDAARTVDNFSARLREQIDLDTLRYELLSVVDETMQPVRASVWLRRTQ
jgi:hypothetical protein